MKIIKSILAVMMIMASVTAFAQYKKASFLEKDGRTYELGTYVHFLRNGRSAQNGFQISIGKETNKKVFLWYDFELTLPSKISTSGIRSSNNLPETITGKSKLGFIFRYNAGYFFLDQSKENKKVNPFLKAGFNIKIGSGIKLNPTNANTSYSNFSVPEEGADGTVGLDFGIGTIFELSKKIGIRCIGGYNVQFTNELFKKYADTKDYEFFPFTNHPYVSLGVRFKISKED